MASGTMSLRSFVHGLRHNVSQEFVHGLRRNVSQEFVHGLRRNVSQEFAWPQAKCLSGVLCMASGVVHGLRHNVSQGFVHGLRHNVSQEFVHGLRSCARPQVQCLYLCFTLSWVKGGRSCKI